MAQYGFIALRTMQGAPYLEARATTIRGVYDVIIARDVSWARFYQAADKVVGIEVPMLLERPARPHGHRYGDPRRDRDRRSPSGAGTAEVLLIAGGAAGTLGMIANLWGDVVGFITPVIVLLWTLAAFGLQELVARCEVRLAEASRGSKLGVAAAALVLPIWNLFDIYPKLAPILRIPGDGPALRAIYVALPPNSAVVAHNYFIARILNYLRLLGRVRSGSESASCSTTMRLTSRPPPPKDGRCSRSKRRCRG